MERFRISDRLQFAVNLSNGNLWVDHLALSVRGTGLNLNLRMSHGVVYSERRWHVNAGRSMALDLSFTDTVLMPTDGKSCARFTANGTGGYSMASNGLRAKLVKNAGGSYTVRFIDTGETWNYNPNGWLLNRTDRNGNAIVYYYNTDGSLASIADTQGRVTTFEAIGARVTRVVDPSGETAAEYTYDSNNNLVEIEDREGETIQIGYNADGRVESLIDQLGRTWSLTYNGGKVSGVTTPRQSGGAVTTSFTYDSATQTTQTDPNNNKTTYTFDSQRRQIQAKDALGHTQSQSWTANSDIQSTTDGLNNSTTGTYDTIGNLLTRRLPTGATATVGYTSPDHPNLPTSTTDPAGRQLTREYDAGGNVTKIRSTPLNADIETRDYSGPKNLLTTVTDGNGRETDYGYDPAGNLTLITPPAPLGQTRLTYDSLSRVSSITDGNGKRIDYAYDRLDRIVAISEHNGPVLQTMSYDAVGGMATRNHGMVSTTFSYDTYPSGRLITTAVRTSAGASETVSYTYDKVGNLKTLVDPAGVATYGYDAANRLTSLADPFGQSTTFGYDNADRRTTTTFPGAGSQTNTYDNSGRLTGVMAKNTAGTELFKASYNYSVDGADRDQIQSRTVNGNTITYTYDSLQHLTQAGSTSYTVDNNDNTTQFDGAPFTINAADQLTAYPNSTVTYDGAGNTKTITSPTGTATWNYTATNQLTTAVLGQTTQVSADYDTTDQTQVRRITENTSGTTTEHVFTHTALGLSSIKVNGTRTSVARDPDGRLVTQQKGTTRHNLIIDHQGSVLAALTTTGTLAATPARTPYGRSTTSPAPVTPFGYHGGYTLNNGLVLFGYRYYNPSIGRFTAPDPTRQERNDYAYAQADPINNSDPTGAWSLPSIGGTVGGFIGGAIGVGLAAACPATAGLGCLGASAVMGGLLGGTGAALGSRLAGGEDEDVSNDGLNGVLGGMLNPLGRFFS
ncbi:RHS repeat-associated core domain-containing protein [Actinophytocola xanthii]|nr:RHS repeat-associated core domain-containing protein [Actinophytocola xanthii]